MNTVLDFTVGNVYIDPASNEYIYIDINLLIINNLNI